jgi:hypothetical protein
MRRIRSWPLLGLAAFVVLGGAGPAFAAPITFTESEKFTKSFADVFLCQDEVYEVTVAGHTVTHLTARTDADGNVVPPLRFHFLIHAAVLAAPSTEPVRATLATSTPSTWRRFVA